MKSIRIILTFIILLLCVSGSSAREKKGVDYFLKPQVGFWFGTITPVYTTRKDVDTNLGGGLFFRYNTPLDDVKFGIDTSYQYFESESVNTLTLWPIYGNLLFRLPSFKKLPMAFQFKLGLGTTYVKIRPDRVDQWDPLGMIGFEASFPAGKVLNIGLRIDYLLIYERYIDGTSRNGHVVNAGITLYFNI